MNDKTNNLSDSCLFALCPDIERCKRICHNRFLIRVFSTEAKILCLHNFVEKNPLFYKLGKGANHET